MLENDRNEARRLARRSGSRCALCAQWNDDLHHALHVLATGETAGYYADYADRPARASAARSPRASPTRATASPFRGGEPRGEPSAHLPPTAFVAFMQNHDQVGNRPFGTRLSLRACRAALPAAAAIVLLSPRFRCCSWARNGRAAGPSPSSAISGRNWPRRCARAGAREFAHFPEFRDQAARAASPTRPRRRPSRCRNSTGANRRQSRSPALARPLSALLAIRGDRDRAPPCADPAPRRRAMDAGAAAVDVEWQLGDGARLMLLANFSRTTPFRRRPPRRRAIDLRFRRARHAGQLPAFFRCIQAAAEYG